MKIEELKSSELGILLPGARAFFAEGSMPGQLNEAHFVASLKALIDTHTGFVLAAFDEEETFLGAIAGACYPEMATGDRALIECFWYVMPDKRMVGPRLLRAFELEGQRRNCVRVHMIHLMNGSADKLDRYYERSGYTILEKVFTKPL